MTEAMKFATKLSIAGTAMEYVSCSIAETRELIPDDEGIRGQRSMQLERATQGLIHVGGGIKMHPTPSELSTIWPYCVNSSTGSTLTDNMQDCAVILDLQTKAYTFSGRFNHIRLSGRPGKQLDLDLDYVGYSCSVGSGGTISGTPDITVRPYMMQDMGSGITIGGTTYSIDEFELSIDNKIEPTFMQGQTATDLMPSGREVTLSVRLKYTSTEQALLTTAQAGPVAATPVTGSLAFTNGTNSATFAFAALIAEPKTVTADNERKLRLPLRYRAFKVGSTLEVVTTFV